jgi:hypothetical protein
VTRSVHAVRDKARNAWLPAEQFARDFVSVELEVTDTPQYSS